jgi:hypothetical protein
MLIIAVPRCNGPGAGQTVEATEEDAASAALQACMRRMS